MARRKFTDERKLEIIREAEQIGISAALRNHKLSYSAFFRWRKQLAEHDAITKKQLNYTRSKYELRLIKEENSRLKKIISALAMELEHKDA